MTALGLEQNGLSNGVTEQLLQAVGHVKLKTLTLDLDNGGVYERTPTRDDFNKQVTLAALFNKGKGDTRKLDMAKSYVGPLGVTNKYL